MLFCVNWPVAGGGPPFPGDAPERLNALSDEMLAALQATFDDIATDQSVRAVVHPRLYTNSVQNRSHQPGFEFCFTFRIKHLLCKA